MVPGEYSANLGFGHHLDVCGVRGSSGHQNTRSSGSQFWIDSGVGVSGSAADIEALVIPELLT